MSMPEPFWLPTLTTGMIVSVLPGYVVTVGRPAGEAGHDGAIRPGQVTVFAALRIIPVTTPGCDIIGTWDALTSMISAAALLAMDSTTSAPAALSLVATTAHDGSFFQAGAPVFSPNAATETGRCDRAITAVCSLGRSAANASWNRATSMDNSP